MWALGPRLGLLGSPLEVAYFPPSEMIPVEIVRWEPAPLLYLLLIMSALDEASVVLPLGPDSAALVLAGAPDRLSILQISADSLLSLWARTRFTPGAWAISPDALMPGRCPGSDMITLSPALCTPPPRNVQLPQEGQETFGPI